MRKRSISTRLHIIMWERNWNESDVFSACQPYCKTYGVRLNKAEIDFYSSGKLSPTDDKLLIIASALNVSKWWLLGYNTPRERSPYEK